MTAELIKELNGNSKAQEKQMKFQMIYSNFNSITEIFWNSLSLLEAKILLELVGIEKLEALKFCYISNRYIYWLYL